MPTKLRALMDRDGWTAAALADKAGVSVATINALCQGKRQPSWVTASKLADALGKTRLSVFALCHPQDQETKR